jgi:hypothetical protein
MPVRSHIRYHRYHMLTGTIRYRYCKTQNLLVHVEKKATVRHRPGPEWGSWGNPQELNWFLPLIKPLRRTRSLRDPAQTQVWSEQVWLDTTFISQGSRSWGKLAVETWRVKTELIIITILHITTTTTSILNLGFKTNCAKNIGAYKMHK